MTNEEMLREFVALPPEGKRVVTDLIAFLRQRYGIPKTETLPTSTDLSSENFIGMWRDRADIPNSIDFARELRSEGWKRSA